MNKSGFSYDGHRVITCDALTETGLVRHGFSTRKEGTSQGKFTSLNLGIRTIDEPEAVRRNFSYFCSDLSIPVSDLVLPCQVHSTKVLRVTKEDVGKGFLRESDLPEADGLVTNQPGVCLGTFYADCTPILLLDPIKRVIAAVHSGWRGTLGRIISEGVRVMCQEYGSDSGQILAAMGPSIKQCHFEVEDDVYHLFKEQFGALIDEYTVQKEKKYYINTDALNIYTMCSMGIRREHISTYPGCTYCESELFFSHRREGATGRMCAMIELV